MSEVEKHYTAAELADLLGVSERTIWIYVEKGETTKGKDGIYPVVKLSHKVVRIPARAVNKFLKARTVAAPVEVSLV
jgi:DNA-binding XRE family transcriptional regulator